MSIDTDYVINRAGTVSAPQDPAMIELAQKFPSLLEANHSASLEGRVEKGPVDTGTKSVSNSNVLFGVGSVLIVIWALLNSVWTWIPRLISYVQHRSLNDGIEKARAEKLIDCLNIVVESPRLGQKAALDQKGAHFGAFSKDELTINVLQLAGQGADEKAIRCFVDKTIQIRDKIAQLKTHGSGLRVDVASVRSLVAEAMRMPIYQQIAHSRDCFAANFLQIIAVKLLSGDGSEALREYGKKKIGAAEVEAKTGTGFQPQEIADHLTRALSGPGFNSDGFLWLKDSKMLWAAAHPMRAIHGLYSNTHPLNYDSGYGNPHHFGHSFEEHGRKIDFYYGPGPTGDPLFEFGVLPAYEKLGIFELRFNHQNTHSSADYARIKDAVRMDNDQHLHAVLSFDKPWAKELAKDFQGVHDFFDEMKEQVKDGLREIRGPKTDSGLYIPEDLLEEPQVDLALAKAEEFCVNLAENNPHWKAAMQTKEGKLRMAKMMILTADTFLTLGMLYGAFDKITPEMIYNQMNAKLDRDLYAIRIAGACKQDIDRAVIENISLRLFYRWATDPSPISADEACEIVGAVLGRARLADNRRIQWRRYEILDDLLRFVGGSQRGGVLLAHSALSEFREGFFSLRPMPERLASAAGIEPGSLLWTPFSWVRKMFG